jgi:hypothetical protein
MSRINYLEEIEDIPADISATIAALETAWRCLPDMSLAELLDTILPAPMYDLTNAELVEVLNEFIHQNQ